MTLTGLPVWRDQASTPWRHKRSSTPTAPQEIDSVAARVAPLPLSRISSKARSVGSGVRIVSKS
jgi:hypothetical protein